MEMSIIGSTCMIPKIVNEELPVNPGLDVVLGCQSINIRNAVFETLFIQDKCIVWFCKDFQKIPFSISHIFSNNDVQWAVLILTIPRLQSPGQQIYNLGQSFNTR